MAFKILSPEEAKKRVKADMAEWKRQKEIEEKKAKIEAAAKARAEAEAKAKAEAEAKAKAEAEARRRVQAEAYGRHTNEENTKKDRGKGNAVNGIPRTKCTQIIIDKPSLFDEIEKIVGWDKRAKNKFKLDKKEKNLDPNFFIIIEENNNYFPKKNLGIEDFILKPEDFKKWPPGGKP